MATRRNVYSYFSRAPNLPIAPTEYSQQAQNQFSNALRLYFNQIDNFINGPTPYGVFYSSSTQTNPVANTAMAVTYNVITESHGVTVDSGSPDSKIYVAQSGVYNFQFSAELDKTGGAATSVYFWFRINGVDIPYSASQVVINGPNDQTVPAWNYITSMSQNDYFQLMWSSPDTAVVLKATAAAAPVPAIPSIIMTATWVSSLPT